MSTWVPKMVAISNIFQFHSVAYDWLLNAEWTIDSSAMDV